MIAALLALVAAVLLAVGYFADVVGLGWAALGVAAVALILVLRPGSRTSDPAPASDPGTTPDVERDTTPDVEPVAAKHEGSEATGDLVLVIPGRRRYHRADCALLADHEVEKLTEDEAREEEFTACTRCVK